jgi:hypothetical protein
MSGLESRELRSKQCGGSGCLSRIPDPDFTHPGSRISDPKTATKEMSEKFFFVIPFYLAKNFTKFDILVLKS